MNARKVIAQLLLAGGLAVAAGSASAGPISAGSWVGFCFSDAGSGATAGCQNDAAQVSGNDFTFTLATSEVLKVTDAFQYGDIFQVYDGGVLLGTTSTVAASALGTTTNPDAAFADAGYSHGTFLLAAGAHSIDIFALASPHGGGGAYMGLFGAVPEPETYALMMAGLGVLGAMARRRRQA